MAEELDGCGHNVVVRNRKEGGLGVHSNLVLTSHSSRSYTLKTSSARPTPCFPSTAIVRTLCAATVISRPRARARFPLSRCRRRRRSALPRRLRLRARNCLLFVTSSFIFLSLSPLLPFVLVSRRGFSRPTPRRPSHLPSPERIWCLLKGSSPLSRFPSGTPVLLP